MAFNGSTLPTYIVKCTICYFQFLIFYQVDNILIDDLKKDYYRAIS
jgi:hypothetical protein